MRALVQPAGQVNQSFKSVNYCPGNIDIDVKDRGNVGLLYSSTLKSSAYSSITALSHFLSPCIVMLHTRALLHVD